MSEKTGNEKLFLVMNGTDPMAIARSAKAARDYVAMHIEESARDDRYHWRDRPALRVVPLTDIEAWIEWDLSTRKP